MSTPRSLHTDDAERDEKHTDNNASLTPDDKHTGDNVARKTPPTLDEIRGMLTAMLSLYQMTLATQAAQRTNDEKHIVEDKQQHTNNSSPQSPIIPACNPPAITSESLLFSNLFANPYANLTPDQIAWCLAALEFEDPKFNKEKHWNDPNNPFLLYIHLPKDQIKSPAYHADNYHQYLPTESKDETSIAAPNMDLPSIETADLSASRGARSHDQSNINDTASTETEVVEGSSTTTQASIASTEEAEDSSRTPHIDQPNIDDDTSSTEGSSASIISPQSTTSRASSFSPASSQRREGESPSPQRLFSSSHSAAFAPPLKSQNFPALPVRAKKN
jgi:hypothetical protein